MSRALRHLRILPLAIGLGAGLIQGCVELPGIYYHVWVDEAPLESDCVKLTDALTEKLNLQLQPTPYQCDVVLDSEGSAPARRVAMVTYPRQRRIQVEINEFDAARKTTLPSPATQQFAQQVMQIVHEQFPAAELVRFRPKRGPIPP